MNAPLRLSAVKRDATCRHWHGWRTRSIRRKGACTEHRFKPRVKRFASPARLKPYLDRAVHVPHLAPPTKVSATFVKDSLTGVWVRQ